MTINWIGKVGLMYISDYGYAAGSSGSISDILSNYKNYYTGNWLFRSMFEWTIVSVTNSDEVVFYKNIDGRPDYMQRSDSKYNVRPAVYLKSNVLTTGGDGSSNPYKIAI